MFRLCGTPNGFASIDQCGVCSGGILELNHVFKIAQVIGVEQLLKMYGICDGPYDIYECGCSNIAISLVIAMVMLMTVQDNGGSASFDECGVCDGDGTTCTSVTEPPAWDCDNDGVLDNLTNYQNSASITGFIIMELKWVYQLIY